MYDVEMERPDGEERAHSSAILAQIANDWGYECEMSRENCPLMEGAISTRRLPCGLNVCASDLLTLQDNERAGLLKRSLMVVFNLGGSRLSYRIDDSLHTSVAIGDAAVVTASDTARVGCSYRTGESVRLLVMQVSPEDLRDPELAEALDRNLSCTRAVPADLSCRARALAQELFCPSRNGIVGRLLAESFALELLANAISVGQEQIENAAPSISARDKAKILAARDQISANLDADYRLVDLAQQAGMSVSTFKFKFNAVVGQPVFHFLRDQRLDRARDLLSSEGWTVAQTAYYVGYRHPSNFATAFKRRFGCAPKEVNRR